MTRTALSCELSDIEPLAVPGSLAFGIASYESISGNYGELIWGIDATVPPCQTEALKRFAWPSPPCFSHGYTIPDSASSWLESFLSTPDAASGTRPIDADSRRGNDAISRRPGHRVPGKDSSSQLAPPRNCPHQSFDLFTSLSNIHYRHLISFGKTSALCDSGNPEGRYSRLDHSTPRTFGLS